MLFFNDIKCAIILQSRFFSYITFFTQFLKKNDVLKIEVLCMISIFYPNQCKADEEYFFDESTLYIFFCGGFFEVWIPHDI